MSGGTDNRDYVNRVEDALQPSPTPAGSKFNMNTSEKWLREKAEQEDNAIVSVGGLVTDIEQHSKIMARSANYVADREQAPREVTFANGRTVRVVGDGYLEVGFDGESHPSQPAPLNGQSWNDDVSLREQPAPAVGAREWRKEHIPLQFDGSDDAPEGCTTVDEDQLDQLLEAYATHVTAAKDAEIAEWKQRFDLACKSRYEQQVRAEAAEADLAGARKELEEERLAHEQVGEALLSLVDTDDGTSVSAARNAAIEITNLRAELSTLREKVNKQAITVIDGKSYCRLCHRCVTDRGHAPGCIVADLTAPDEQA